MNTQKLIKKLMKKAEIIDKIDISSENITEIPLEDFYKEKGKVYYHNNAFYKKSDYEWFVAKINPIIEENTPKLAENELKKRVEALESWAVKFKASLDPMITRINQAIKKIEENQANIVKIQNDIVTEFKEYIDNKFKEKTQIKPEKPIQKTKKEVRK